ncbi:tagaturonate reductase [Hymenobacter sp.]|uniref:tagaturonate reductase n=1 Tax=Hymenobacter sp. TaxID=1898978 RepID=UPI00286CFE82|nr:tagaturonate reductase [Hymenobacter sp.]
MKNLSRAVALTATTALVLRPTAALLELPEKVLQFGTGVLLRGLPDYLIDKANRQGIFNGRIVVVKSTDGGDLSAFERQDNLYTLGIRGVADGHPVEENVVCASISQVLSADSQWAEVLACARNPELRVVISNTTEVGIELIPDDVRQAPPRSFPGKLLAVLYARFQAFNGDKTKGLVIVPTELIPNNGRKLEAILLELAYRNDLESEFIEWLGTANACCNSLVDRIVPGRPTEEAYYALTTQLGYQDELLTMAEAYLLWAIEGNERVKAVLSFHRTDSGVIIQPDIDLFRELKLRLLNGTHTLSCGLAFLSGCATVREAMDNALVAGFIQSLLNELRLGIPYPVDEETGRRFGSQVLDRLRNPAIEHRWLTITAQCSLKMRLRNVPTLRHYSDRFGTAPPGMALGFAAYLLFMRGTRQQGKEWYGTAHTTEYTIQDEQAGYFAGLWSSGLNTADLTTAVLQNQALWGHDLSQLPGFAASVSDYLQQLLETGVAATVGGYLTRATTSAR